MKGMTRQNDLLVVRFNLLLYPEGSVRRVLKGMNVKKVEKNSRYLIAWVSDSESRVLNAFDELLGDVV